MGRATPVAAAFLAETRASPIVFVNVADPVGAGFVASLARPGGNLTGMTSARKPHRQQMAGFAAGAWYTATGQHTYLSGNPQ